ncbi:MAG: hypothetical protein ABIE23_05020 [archaeon]|nr:hypothetical protein [Candidatus Micrarchaeota archaeon]
MKLIKSSFSRNDLVVLRGASNECIEKAALTSNRNLAKISLIAYALHKLISKPHFIKSRKWKEARQKILFSLDRSIDFLERNKFNEFEKELEKLSQRLRSVDSSLGNFMQNVYDKARVKQASRAYALGLSLSQAASLTDSSTGDLLSYVGSTKIHEKEKPFISIKDRKKFLEELFSYE